MLEIAKVSKSFGNRDEEKLILDDISFSVADGEFLCLLGPSGCGKTTLIRCVGGFEEISAGRILLNGQEILGPGIDRIMVFQTFDQLFRWKTVEANIDYPLRINGIQKDKRKELVKKYLELVELEDYAHYYPHQLSGGMKQRTAIARALALEPPVLLMDEPFGSLDALTRHTLQNELIELWGKLRTTIIFVTHDIEEAIILADRILVMSRYPGKIKNIIVNHLQRPRKPGMEGFTEMWDFLYDRLGSYIRKDNNDSKS